MNPQDRVMPWRIRLLIFVMRLPLVQWLLDRLGKKWAELSEAEVATPEDELGSWEIALDAAKKDFADYHEGLSDDDLFTVAPRAAIAAFHLERFDEARALAHRAIALAPSFRSSWNYGNALHLGHTVLGLLALRDGDVATAVLELRQSGDTPGSPQLDSFGPTMQLARALLERGERDHVLGYLKQCRSFWSMGRHELDIWERKVQSGAMPVFFHHRYG